MRFAAFHRLSSALLFLCLSVIGTGTLMPYRRSARIAGRERSHTSHFAQKNRISLQGDFDIQGQTNANADDIPPFNVYFAGTHTTSDANGLYSFVVEQENKEYLNNISLIICKRLEPHFEQGATLSNIEITKLNKTEWYDLTRSYNEKTKKYYWDYTEKVVKKGDTIPPNAIILLLSSARVVSVEKTVQSTTGPTDLPKIILANDPIKLKRASIKSDIEAITLRRLTDERKPRVRVQNGVRQSLVG